MSFEQKDWKDRIAEYINRRRITHEDGTSELITVERDEGTISQEGDAFNAENMNEFEERIAKALTPLDTMEEINANTQDNQLAGALAVKELGASLGKIKYKKISMDTNAEGASHIQCIKNNWESLDLDSIYLLTVEVGAKRLAIVQKYGIHTYGSVFLFGYGLLPCFYSLSQGVWSSPYDMVYQAQLAKYLPLSGGQMTGEIKIGSGDGQGIQLNTNGKINATIGGLTNCTVLGMYGGEYLNVGYPSLPTRIRGSEADLKYNGRELLAKDGGTMTGEIRIGQGDGKGIQLGLNGVVNATNTDGATTCTVLGSQAGVNTLVGHQTLNLILRGLGESVRYNGRKLLTASDFVVTGSANEATLTINLD